MFDCVVIGSGPAGYAAAIYLGRSNSSVLLIASELHPGGNLVNATTVENFPGFPEGISGPELMEKMRDQAEKFGTELVYENAVKISSVDDSNTDDNCGSQAQRDEVEVARIGNGDKSAHKGGGYGDGDEGVDKADVRADNGDGDKIESAKEEPNVTVWEVETSHKSYLAKTVILALGSSYRKLDVPGEFEFLGKGVSFCATCDGFFFKDQKVAVIGGGDTALEEALFLANFAAKVYIVHRRDILRASKILQERVKRHPKIELVLNSRVKEIQGDSKTGVQQLLLASVSDAGAERPLDVKGVFVAIGHDPNTEMVRGVVDLDEFGYIKLTNRQSTNQIGIFAAGDATDPIYRQAITAAASGARAAVNAIQYLESIN